MKRSLQVFSKVAAVLLIAAMVISVSGCERKVNDLSRFETVVFGKYEQDSKLENGAEPLEWIVVEKTDTDALLMTKYGVIAKDYFIGAGKEGTVVSWSKCSLRRWIENTFYVTAFTAAEKALIIPEKFTDEVTGKTVEDKVTLPTAEQARTLFLSNKERRITTTEYGMNSKAYINIFTGAGWWWLRDMGEKRNSVQYVGVDGKIIEKGNYADFSHAVVRLAVRVKLEALNAE